MGIAAAKLNASGNFGSRYDRYMKGESAKDILADQISTMAPEQQAQLGGLLDNLGNRIGEAKVAAGDRFNEAKVALQSQGASGGNLLDALKEVLADLDNSYAGSVRSANIDGLKGSGVTTPIFLNSTGPVPYNGRSGPLSPNASLERERVANVMSRYALPIGGVTLAGVGISDIANALGGGNNDTTGQIPM